MNYTFSVERYRASVTQGDATVLLNGIALVTFSDTIRLIETGQDYYGENIGGWASITPDNEFICGVLWHPLDDTFHYRNKAVDVLRTYALLKADVGEAVTQE